MRGWISRLKPVRPAVQPETTAAAGAPRLPFAEVEGKLALYVTALSDGTLKIGSSSSAASGSYSDGRTIFFPPSIEDLPSLDDARRLYRVMAAWKVLQVRTGCLDLQTLPEAPNPAAALALYEAIHGEWLDRRLAATYPGLAGDLRLLRRDALQRRANGARDGHPVEPLLCGLLSLSLDDRLDADHLGALAIDLGGSLRLGAFVDRLQRSLAATDPEESRMLAFALSEQLPPVEEHVPLSSVHYRGRIRYDLVLNYRPTFEEEQRTSGSAGNGTTPRRRGDAILVDARSHEQRVLRERRASRGGRQAVQLSLGDREPTMTLQQVPLTEAEKRDALLYREWDHRIGQYHDDWCAVRLRHPRGGNTEAVDRILRQHAPLIARLKQQFEALRPERLRLTRQLDGDDLDLNAIVTARADRRAGSSPSEKLYSRTLERERNIALGCLIDLSGSTGAWIDDDPRNDQVIEITRRALVFLCEALTMLDDRYAIYGFTSSTRKRCDVSIVKAFEEHYGETVRGRIAGLAPGSYTRIGPAIRHTAQALTQQPARVRLLLLISDGRPNDFDGYGGRYGIEDTRKALIEARQSGVSTFALTIDAEARDYMPYMFGPNHYVVVENAPALAIKLTDIYRSLTVQ